MRRRRATRLATVLFLGTLLGSDVFDRLESPRVLCSDALSVHKSSSDEDVVVLSTSTNRWRVNRSAGTIAALSLDSPTPIWSSSGVFYRALPTRGERPVVFSGPIVCVEIDGLVYFQFSELVRAERSSEPFASLVAQGRLVVVDPRREGRVAWFVRGEDVCKLFTTTFPTERDPHGPSCRFVETPRMAANNEVQLVAERLGRRLELSFNASSGKLISYRSL